MKSKRHIFSSRMILALFLLVLTFFPLGATAQTSKSLPTNIILLIADGMGPQQLGLLLQYYRASGRKEPSAVQTMLASGSFGMVLPYVENNLVVDSACVATQLASGESCRAGMIGLNRQAESVKTVLDHAKGLGKSTGLVSDTRITHATPAAFFANALYRDQEALIAEQSVSQGADVMLSGGLNFFLPRDVSKLSSEISQRLRTVERLQPLKSKRHDQKDLLKAADVAGYALAFNRKDLLAASSTKVLGLFSLSGMPNGIEQRSLRLDPNRQVPSLSEMTTAALGLLDKNERGFFLMVEAGQIDWAAHCNDVGTLMHELLEFDLALEEILIWARQRNDTLVIVTADHETGGFGFSYSSHEIPQARELKSSSGNARSYQPSYNFGSEQTLLRIAEQQKSFYSIVTDFKALTKSEQTAMRLAEMINDNLAFTITQSDARRILKDSANKNHYPWHKNLRDNQVPHIDDFSDFYPAPIDRRAALIARALAAQQGVVWATGTHTSTPVPILAFGPGSSEIMGMQSHREIGNLILRKLSN